MQKILHNTSNSTEQTLQLIEKHAFRHGITRSADITDFSPVKLPVWISLRPNAKCLSQSAGKGLCSDSAKISSIMEGIEVSTAENVQAATTTLYSLEEIEASEKRHLNIYAFPLDPCLQRNEKISWATGYSLIDHESCHIPIGMLTLDFTIDKHTSRPRHFRSTSNGLASGLTTEEALVSALLETVERHSITLNNKLNGNLKTIDIEGSAPPSIAFVLDELNKNDIDFLIYDATIIEGLYTIESCLYSPSGTIQPTSGSGTSTCLEIAILRAILEANQAATILMSGSRDDLAKDIYIANSNNCYDMKSLKKLTKAHRTVDKSEYRTLEMTPSDELKFIMEKIRAYTSADIIAYNYTPIDTPIVVCKTLIPYFEGYYTAKYNSVSEKLSSASDENESSALKLAAGGRL